MKLSKLIILLVAVLLSTTADADNIEYVDLGLPSGTLWANMNLGAQSPYEYGDYFAFGEIETKENFTSENYKWKDLKADDFRATGIVDQFDCLLPDYDAATYYLGDKWRIPTAKELAELESFCTSEWKTINGITGRLFTGSNGNTIFLPCGGFILNPDRSWCAPNKYGCYRSSVYYYKSELKEESSYVMEFNSNWTQISTNFLESGLTIRPVFASRPSLPEACPEAIDLGLTSGTKWANINIGATKPEEYGGYFPWGETKLIMSYYPLYSPFNGLTESEVRDLGAIDSNRNLTQEYDAASVLWGNGWHMPTVENIIELGNECKWVKSTLNNVEGYKIIGPNGNFIFLPFAGSTWNFTLSGAQKFGLYWTSTSQPGNFGTSYCISLSQDNFESYYWTNNSQGISIRPVINDNISGIISTISERQQSDEYNLMGQKVIKNSQHGIFIVNGKKILK